jgi:hypothetical protein
MAAGPKVKSEDNAEAQEFSAKMSQDCSGEVND